MEREPCVPDLRPGSGAANDQEIRAHYGPISADVIEVKLDAVVSFGQRVGVHAEFDSAGQRARDGRRVGRAAGWCADQQLALFDAIDGERRSAHPSAAIVKRCANRRRSNDSRGRYGPTRRNVGSLWRQRIAKEQLHTLDCDRFHFVGNVRGTRPARESEATRRNGKPSGVQAARLPGPRVVARRTRIEDRAIRQELVVVLEQLGSSPYAHVGHSDVSWRVPGPREDPGRGDRLASEVEAKRTSASTAVHEPPFIVSLWTPAGEGSRLSAGSTRGDKISAKRLGSPRLGRRCEERDREQQWIDVASHTVHSSTAPKFAPLGGSSLWVHARDASADPDHPERANRCPPLRMSGSPREPPDR